MKPILFAALAFALAFTPALVLAPAAAPAAELLVQDVAPGVWAIEGPSVQRDPDNLGNNATFGLIETTDGAVLIDPGGTWAGAAALHAVIRDLTAQPVTRVIDTGGQDHRWLGNGYWKAQGAAIIASADAVADQKARGSMQLTTLSQLVGDGVAGTEPVHADTVFDASLTLVQGGRRIEIRHTGGAHTPGDSFVWLPDARVVFTGDIVYVGRLLGVTAVSDTESWLEAFAAIEALDPAVLVPGHGPATTLARAQADTRDYLLNLRAKMRAHIDAGGDIIGSVGIDQSGFAHLAQFDALAKRNAQAAFEQMEWD